MPEVDNEVRKEFNEWLDGKPEVIKEMAVILKPWNKYRLKQTGQHCSICSYNEDGTVTVNVDGHDNDVLGAMNKMVTTQVFGIYPNDLEALDVDA